MDAKTGKRPRPRIWIAYPDCRKGIINHSMEPDTTIDWLFRNGAAEASPVC